MNLGFGECFINVLEENKAEKTKVFLGMAKNKRGEDIGVWVCDPERKNPRLIRYKFRQIKPVKTIIKPVHSPYWYKKFFEEKGD